ncbi:hypothetical protein ACKA06_14680 [Rossellomorea oryzaecorticis]|uniref:Uncharacterized protein n=1 Tax=Rossellomorea oryzaecorticis TaxID=1396505 RepID=A0ABW8VST0_9BACI
MELDYQTEPDYQPDPKKNGTRTFLNSIGLVIFGGFLLQSLTVPFTITGSGEFSKIEEIKMSAGESNYRLPWYFQHNDGGLFSAAPYVSLKKGEYRYDQA